MPSSRISIPVDGSPASLRAVDLCHRNGKSRKSGHLARVAPCGAHPGHRRNHRVGAEPPTGYRRRLASIAKALKDATGKCEGASVPHDQNRADCRNDSAGSSCGDAKHIVMGTRGLGRIQPAFGFGRHAGDPPSGGSSHADQVGRFGTEPWSGDVMPQNQKFEIPESRRQSGRENVERARRLYQFMDGRQLVATWSSASSDGCPTPVQARLSLGVSKSVRSTRQRMAPLRASAYPYYRLLPPSTRLRRCFGAIPRLLGNRHVRDNDQKSGSSIFAQRRNGSEVPRFRRARFHAALGPGGEVITRPAAG